MESLEDKIYEESRKRYPYHETHLSEDDIKQGAFEMGALWVKEYLFNRFKKELQKLGYQQYPGGPCERVIFDSQPHPPKGGRLSLTT